MVDHCIVHCMMVDYCSAWYDGGSLHCALQHCNTALCTALLQTLHCIVTNSAYSDHSDTAHWESMWTCLFSGVISQIVRFKLNLLHWMFYVKLRMENSEMVTNSKYDSNCRSQPGTYKSLLNTRAVAGDKVETVHEFHKPCKLWVLSSLLRLWPTTKH